MDKGVKRILKLTGYLFLIMLAGIVITLIYGSAASIRKFGLGFIWGKEWNPVTGHFGALPFIVGTLITSFLALLISFPFSMAISLFLGEYFKKGLIAKIIESATDLLAGIPSVVYGFWGLMVFVPVMRKIEMKFGILPYGVGILTASLILSIMIIPYTSSLVTEVLKLVPSDLKEAAYGLGATRFEVIKKVILPYTKSGILAGLFLALGRALGETMAVTMVIGNRNAIPHSLFAPGNTMASVIANEFTEATENLYLSSLIEIGLLLFVITVIVNYIGNKIIKRYSV